MKKKTSKPEPKLAVITNVNPFDPENINARLYRQVSVLLNQLEEKNDEDGEYITIRERIAALTAIGRLQLVFANLRKGSNSDTERGSAVRKYETAFTPHAVGRREAGGGPAGSEPEPDNWFDKADVDTGDDPDAA